MHSLSPAFFERLIVDLLCRMGYGGGKLEMGRALGRVGDGGVDGVIKEDELGLDVVYVQAKRFAQEKSVPIREVRDFVGGLEGHRASKGVFVTTSYFPSTAYDFITRVSKRVVLIDGAGTRQPDDAPLRRRARHGGLSVEADRRGLFRGVAARRKANALRAARAAEGLRSCSGSRQLDSAALCARRSGTSCDSAAPRSAPIAAS